MSGAISTINGMKSLDTMLSRAGARTDSSFSSLLNAASADQTLPFAAQGAKAFPLEIGDKFMPVRLPKSQPIAIRRDSPGDAISLRGVQPLDEAKLRDSAKKLVASALLTPLLEEMENSSLRPTEGPFAKNVVEKRFGPLLHQHMADRMIQSGGRTSGLVDAVIKRMGGGRVETIA